MAVHPQSKLRTTYQGSGTTRLQWAALGLGSSVVFMFVGFLFASFAHGMSSNIGAGHLFAALAGSAVGACVAGVLAYAVDKNDHRAGGSKKRQTVAMQAAILPSILVAIPLLSVL